MVTPTIAERFAELIELLILAIEEQFAGGGLSSRLGAPVLQLTRNGLRGIAARVAAALACAAAPACAAALAAEPTPPPAPEPRPASQTRKPPQPLSWSQRLRRSLPAWMGGRSAAPPRERRATQTRRPPRPAPRAARPIQHRERPAAPPVPAPPDPPALIRTARPRPTPHRDHARTGLPPSEHAKKFKKRPGIAPSSHAVFITI